MIDPVFSQIAWLIVSPGLDAITCRLAAPECLVVVLITELAILAETVQGPVSAVSKSPFWIKLTPTSGTLPCTSFRSSTYTSPAVPCIPTSKMGLVAAPVTVTYCHGGPGAGELELMAAQLPARQLSWLGSINCNELAVPLALVGHGSVPLQRTFVG